jgi:hypothetical protein
MFNEYIVFDGYHGNKKESEEEERKSENQNCCEEQARVLIDMMIHSSHQNFRMFASTLGALTNLLEKSDWTPEFLADRFLDIVFGMITQGDRSAAAFLVAAAESMSGFRIQLFHQFINFIKLPACRFGKAIVSETILSIMRSILPMSKKTRQLPCTVGNEAAREEGDRPGLIISSKSSILLSENNCTALCPPNSSKTAYVVASFSVDMKKGIEESGNYFEVEILASELFESCAIGIGFGKKDFESPDGSVAGTQGYEFRGDGRRYRRSGSMINSSTITRNYPQFNAGDVVGCGLDVAKRSIFYTRNGIFLGNGFLLPVDETVLTPIICFYDHMGCQVS